MARVLHIEDDPANRLLVRKILESVGHEVTDATTGLEGVRLASASKPELVLVDINIPDLDGYEVILRLKGMRDLRHVPIVAITAEGDRAESMAVGADGFIQKPFDARRFPATVNRYLGTSAGASAGAVDRTPEGLLRERSQKIVERLEQKVLQLSEANQRLEDLARLRREFLRNVSHELATPMTPVVGYLKLLLDEELGPLTPLQRKCLRSVEGSTRRLRAVVDTLLDVSSLESQRMHFYHQPYDLVDVATRAIKETEAIFENRGIRIARGPGLLAGPIPGVGDADKLRRAVVHVLDNAAKFTPKGGVAGVDVRREGDLLVCEIADSGPGVDPKNILAILEPFFQADGSVTRTHGGVGLGLAFSRRVCEALGGRIEVRSPPPDPVAGEGLTGTLVRLWVQAKAPPVEAPGPTSK